KGSCESWNSNFKSVDDCKAWYKSNGMIVNVFYESLEYQVLTENAAYSIPLAINDLGGQAGLWLGLSVVSVVECIGLFFLLLLFCITGKRLSVTPEREVGSYVRYVTPSKHSVKLRPEEGRMGRVTTILVDFACWSTVACVRNVALSESKLLRFFWFLIFMTMVAAFIAQFVMIIIKYVAYPADVSTTIVFSSQPFPDVTFCNYNPFKWSVVSKNPDFADIKRMMIEYRDVDAGLGTTNEFGFEGLSRFERQDRATDMLVFLAAQLTEQQKEPALYELEELVTECLYAGNTCDPDLLEEMPDPLYGRCFVYRGGNQTITRAGLAHGLRLILTANLADSYTFVSDYLPTTMKVGVRMTVNEEDSLVSHDNHGFHVGVGFQTSIAISKSRTIRVQAPYGKCIPQMAPDANYYSELPYTIDSCFTTCLQKRIVERCGCAHPSYRKAVNDTWCITPEDATCIASQRGDQLNTTDPNLSPIGDCGCKAPCLESYFSSTLSVLTYPAFSYTVGVGTTEQNNNQKEEQTPDPTTTSTTTSTSTTTKTTTTPTTTTTTTTTTAKPSTTTSNLCPPLTAAEQVTLVREYNKWYAIVVRIRDVWRRTEGSSRSPMPMIRAKSNTSACPPTWTSGGHAGRASSNAQIIDCPPLSTKLLM
ncbi:hypothetical protein PENTCL1PPCAC_29767, partial [Pristionchus entomophagus]